MILSEKCWNHSRAPREQTVVVSRRAFQHVQLGAQLLLQPVRAGVCSPALLVAGRSSRDLRAAPAAAFQATGQGVHITQSLAQPGFLIIPIPFKPSHLSLHAVFYTFETLVWARHWTAPQSLPKLGSEHQCESVQESSWPQCSPAHLHQLRVWTTWEYSGLGFRTEEWGHGDLDLQGLWFQWT